MELWIRSQKNDNLRPMLVKVNELELGDYGKNLDCIVVNNLHCVGIYKTKERALEVLDEIQNKLKPKLKIVQSDDTSLPIMNGEWANSIREKTEFDTIQLLTYVYEMPKE